jgi:hypothetical protein
VCLIRRDDGTGRSASVDLGSIGVDHLDPRRFRISDADTARSLHAAVMSCALMWINIAHQS